MTIIIIIALCLLAIVINVKRKEAEEKRDRELFRLQHNSDVEHYESNTVSNLPKTLDVEVKGTFYRTPDEISAARMCEVGDTVILEPEPCNKADSFAVKVKTMEGFHIGYVNSDFSKLVNNNIKHISKCIITRITAHNIPFISIKIYFALSKTQQPGFIPQDYQCGPEDMIRNLSTTPVDSYNYRRVCLMVQDLYERDRSVIAKARACRKGDKIILKKGVCNELYPDRIDIYLADETYLGYAEPFGSKEVYMLFDKIVDSFVEYPVSLDSRNQFGVRVIFPVSVKCPKECMPESGIGFYYSGNYQEVKMASDLRRTDPADALDILLPVVKKEKGIDAHLECIACYYQLKEWQNRIDMIRATLDRIESYTEEDYPREELADMRRYMEKLYKQLEFSQKRLESQDKKRRK